MFDFEYIKQDPEAVGQVIGAIIGVTGLFIGTFITILTSFIVRYMDIKREERKELSSVKKAKKEKEFYLKQEIYSKFISELASFENFLTKKASNLSVKNLDNFDDEWTRTEIRVEGTKQLLGIDTYSNASMFLLNAEKIERDILEKNPELNKAHNPKVTGSNPVPATKN
jgi:ABC-type lipoprotein release transport system permease subunit